MGILPMSELKAKGNSLVVEFGHHLWERCGVRVPLTALLVIFLVGDTRCGHHRAVARPWLLALDPGGEFGKLWSLH